jgi:hypothetical protein
MFQLLSSRQFTGSTFSRNTTIIWLLFLSILPITASSVTRSEPAGVKAADLQGDCSGPNTSMGYNYCLGFIVGIVSSFDCEKPSMDGLHWQPTEGLNAGQLRKVFIKWLENHPQYLHLRREYVVAAAVSDAFPCR